MLLILTQSRGWMTKQIHSWVLLNGRHEISGKNEIHLGSPEAAN